MLSISESIAFTVEEIIKGNVVKEFVVDDFDFDAILN